jgi:PqqD family protein of HPr-rel-A system
MQEPETLLIEPRRQTNTRWRVPQNAEFHWKRWEDLFALYHSGSGQTHVLDPLAVLLIQLVGEGPRTSSELLEQMVKQLDVDTSQEFQEELQQTLWQLDDLGLIEAVVA